MQPERITHVAVRVGKRLYKAPGPARHHQLPRAFGVFGFITDTGRFILRDEARLVAETAGQLREGVADSKWLYAEDLGW